MVRVKDTTGASTVMRMRLEVVADLATNTPAATVTATP